MVRLARTLGAALLAVAASGCGGGSGSAAKAPEPAAVSASTAVDRLLPLTDGYVLAYDTVDEETGTRGMFVTRVRRAAGARVELATAGRTRVLELLPDGVARAPDRAYLLRAPLTLGATWPGEGGTKVRISAVDKAMDVPAGKFVGCVETVEESGGDAKKRATTVFCPDVGIVMLEVEAWAGAEHALERATLRSFGPAVELGGKKQ